jgi:hypothetical protein
MSATMKKPPTKILRMVPLQKLGVRPIEDPVEQAALDDLLKRREDSATAASQPTNAPTQPKRRRKLAAREERFDKE